MNSGTPALVMFQRAHRVMPECPVFRSLLSNPVMESVVMPVAKVLAIAWCNHPRAPDSQWGRGKRIEL